MAPPLPAVPLPAVPVPPVAEPPTDEPPALSAPAVPVAPPAPVAPPVLGLPPVSPRMVVNLHRLSTHWSGGVQSKSPRHWYTQWCEWHTKGEAQSAL